MTKLILLFFTIVLSFILTAVFFRAIQKNWKNWQFLFLALLPTILISVLNPHLRVYGAHSFMHVSFVYQIVNGYIPPYNPILGGETLQYPWAHHLLVAGIVSLFHISPSAAFALINVTALLLTIVLVFKMSLFIYSSRISAIFAPFLSIFGITIFYTGLTSFPLNQLSKKLISLSVLYGPFSLANKFSHTNSMPLGILFFSLFLYSSLYIFAKKDCNWRYYLLFLVSFIGSGFFYPLIWLLLPACWCANCTVIYLQKKRESLSVIARTLICIIGGTLVVTPYLYLISSGKSEATIAITPNFYLLFVKSFRLFLTLLPISIVIFWKRSRIVKLLQVQKTATIILMATAATTALIFLVLFIQTDPMNDYKYLMLSCFSLGILASVCMEEIYLKNRIISFLLIWSFSISITATWIKKLNPWKRQITDQYVEDGKYLRHGNPIEDELYEWIGNQTASNSIFIDTYLTIPVFGRRQLYVGLDLRREQSLKPYPSDGWSATADRILQIHGYSDNIINARRNVAQEIYSEANIKIDKEILLKLNHIANLGDVYIVARNEIIKSKLTKNLMFSQVFANEKSSIYKFLSVPEEELGKIK